MNKYKQMLNNRYLTEQLESYCMQVTDNRPYITKRTAGDLNSIDKNPCELLKLLEITEYNELWEVRFLDGETSFCWFSI